MIFQAGLKTYEIGRALALPKLLLFKSGEEALTWLKQIGSTYPEVILKLREYLVRFFDDPESFRMTEHATLEQLAQLLYSRRVGIVVREKHSQSGAPRSNTPSNPVAFPLSERRSRQSSVSYQPITAEDPPTLDSRVDAVAQAAALVAAANEGMAMCPM
jgi:hypothetical protein